MKKAHHADDADDNPPRINAPPDVFEPRGYMHARQAERMRKKKKEEQKEKERAEKRTRRRR